jgi:cytochrome c oxidase subunit 3
MFFAAIFAAYLYFGAGDIATGEGGWPPAGLARVEPWGIPALNTGLLLASGVAVVLAHHSFLSGRTGSAQLGLALAIALGLVFLALQINEFITAPFGYRDGAYPSVFFIGTGFHGLHVFIGILLLAIALARLSAGQFTTAYHFGLEAPIWYWHFVDVVWLFLYALFYW